MHEADDHCEIYHIGSDEEVSINARIENLSKVIHCKARALPSPSASGGTPRRCPDISKICLLGYRLQAPLVEGLIRICEWCLARSECSIANELE